MNEVTQILAAMGQGDPKAGEELLPIVYQEIRKLAAAKMAREAPGQTLQATALVHEAWIRLIGSDQHTWQNRAHFFAAAAESMRRILIENARRKRAVRHGGGQERVAMNDFEIPEPNVQENQLLAINEALEKFSKQDPEKAEIVKLRYFAGLTFEEVAELKRISVPTAKRWWAYARAELYREVSKELSNP